MTIQKKIQLVNTLKANPELSQLVQKIQLVYADKTIDINKTIQDLKLPLNYHLYLTGNFSELMTLKFN